MDGPDTIKNVQYDPLYKKAVKFAKNYVSCFIENLYILAFKLLFSEIFRRRKISQKKLRKNGNCVEMH